MEVRDSKNVVKGTRLDAGAALTGVGSSGAVVGGLCLMDEDAAIAEQGPAGYDGDDAIVSPLASVTFLSRSRPTMEDNACG